MFFWDLYVIPVKYAIPVKYVIPVKSVIPVILPAKEGTAFSASFCDKSKLCQYVLIACWQCLSVLAPKKHVGANMD